MGEAEAPRVSSKLEFPGETATAAPPQAQAPPAPQPTPRAPGAVTDPLSRPYTLPSRGLYYGAQCLGGVVTISPTRGAQEEILAGAQGSSSALPALRHVAEQCIDTHGLAFNDLLLFDFSAMLFHFLALSNGTDELTLTPTHSGSCGKSFKHVLPLTQLPCTTLRCADQGEEPNWPPVHDGDEDGIEAVLADMDAAETGGVNTDYALAPDSVPEPFITEPMPITGDVIGWRYHRLHDLVQAEEFVNRANQGAGKLHSFLMAAQLVSLNGRAFTGKLEAMTWVKRQPSPILHALRDDISHRDFGYDVNPRFRCPHCGGSFKGRLPLDGSLFRRSRRR